MTEDFESFFDAVRRAAKAFKVKAFTVCAVIPDGGGSVRVAGHAGYSFEGKPEEFRERCIDAMEESLDITLTQLANEDDDTPEFMN